MYDHELDRKIERLALKQAGAFNHGQALRLGATEKMIAARLRSGLWTRLATGVYALAAHAGTFERQCWGAVLGEPDAAVAGFAAAHVLSFPGFRPGRPEIVVPPDGNARNPIALVHRYDGPRVTAVRGLPVTSRAQTVFDIAARISVDRLERAIDDELAARRLTIEELEERLVAYSDARRAGLKVMRWVVADRRHHGFVPTASELERCGDRILRRLDGSPEIVHEASFDWLDRGRGRVDRFLPAELILLEWDSRRWHTRVADFDRDRWRDNQAAAAGIAVLRFTYAHVKTRPSEVLAIIELTRRARRRQSAA